METFWPDPFEPVRELDTLQIFAITKGRIPDALESFWEINFRKITTVFEYKIPNCLQLAPLLERDLLQASTALKCTILNFLNIP